jgi:hypothetical protein
MGLPRWNAEINQFIANECVLEVHDEPLAESIQDDFIEIPLFDLPIPVHPRCELVPLRLWNEHCARVIVRIRWKSLLAVPDMLFLSEPRTRLVLFNDCIHVSPSD